MADDLSDDDWTALLARQPFAGVVAVKTTGIVCRAGCPARTPLRKNVEKYASREDALAAGFRLCKRCWSEVGKAQENPVGRG